MYVPYEIFNTIFELSEEQLHSNLSKSIKVPCPRENNSWKVCKKKKKTGCTIHLYFCTLVGVVLKI